MSNERAQLAMDAALLPPGSTIRMVCPFCGGGSTKEASLALTHADHGQLLFYCHRSKCNAKGMLGGGPYIGRGEGPEPKPREFDLTGSTESFPLWVRERCQEHWHLNPLDARGWLWHGDTCRIIMPVIGPKGKTRGHVARVPPEWNAHPKTLNHVINDAEPFLHWKIHGTELVVVEDIPSAVRLHLLGYSAVALCGVRMGPDESQEICDSAKLWDMERVLVALDRDAANLTFRYAEVLRLRGLAATPLLIDRDFKNMTEEEIICTVSNDS